MAKQPEQPVEDVTRKGSLTQEKVEGKIQADVSGDQSDTTKTPDVVSPNEGQTIGEDVTQKGSLTEEKIEGKTPLPQDPGESAAQTIGEDVTKPGSLIAEKIESRHPISDGNVSAKGVIHRTLLDAIIEDISANAKPNTTGLVVVSRYKISKLVKSLTHDYSAQYQANPQAFLFRDNAKVLVVTSDELAKGLDAIKQHVNWALVDESVTDDSGVKAKL